jgi:hypothetical protein
MCQKEASPLGRKPGNEKCVEWEQGHNRREALTLGNEDPALFRLAGGAARLIRCIEPPLSVVIVNCGPDITL